MKRIVLLATLFAAIAVIASAQSMSDSSSGAGSDKGSMMAPSDSQNGAPSTKNSNDTMMASPNAMKGSSESMMAPMDYETLKKEGKLADIKMGIQLRMATSSGMKESYKNLMSVEALASKNPTVLLFSADWCPSCQADLKDINSNGAQLGKVSVVVVDYDKNMDLKKKYGITFQDTYVQIGPMGEKVAIWSGGGVQGILDNIKKPM